ncbi:hypothetical protein AVEN_107525-1 [Araneus ventricosus]|uniref:Uncharacterized protein n=1 Tax=Araneus ventricosus TaxID=182803 RepID=A0A4Y2NH21_ARAVE|nr:hypothetical protein AVEN_107525-1 [Araneus ventricosus]
MPNAYSYPTWKDGIARPIKTDLLKMSYPEKKAQCVLGYVMFFWGYVKDVVYRTKVHNVAELNQKFQAVIKTVDQCMLQRFWMELEYRRDYVMLRRGLMWNFTKKF